MDGSISLADEERKMLLQVYRSGRDVRVARRAHVILLWTDGWTWQEIQEALYCSTDLIVETLRCFANGGVTAVLERSCEPPVIPAWLLKVKTWLTTKTPQDFGYFRTRWSCEIVANLLAWETGVRLSGETIRRGLKKLGFVWRRPRPVVGPTDPQYAEKLNRIRELLDDLPADEVAVFQDEVDVHLNPKIGSTWMPKGEQATVTTPGNNRKCHVAGSLVWTTGTLLVSPPEARRNTATFLSHLDDLRRRLRGWKKIHVICDNAAFHKSRAVQDYLVQWGHRVAIHFLPAYAPETNPIERVWWHLHETITRNHKCHTLEELLDQAYDWFQTNNNHFFDMRHTFAKAA
jgi:putative transposase